MGRRAAARAPERRPRAREPGAPRRRAGPRGADAEAARRARRLHPPTRPQTGREGGGGGGTEPSAIFPSSPKHTHTPSHTHAPGTPVRGEPGPEPPPRAPAPPGPGVGAAGKPPGRRGAGRTHTPLALLPAAKSSCCPGKARPPRPLPAPGEAATHRTTRASGLRQQDTRNRRHHSVPGQDGPAASRAPGEGDGRRSVRRGCGDSSGAGTPRSQRPPRSGGRSSSSAADPLPFLSGRALRPDGLRAVRLSCVTSSRSSSRSGRFAGPRSPSASALRACSLRCGSPLAPGADRAGR